MPHIFYSNIIIVFKLQNYNEKMNQHGPAQHQQRTFQDEAMLWYRSLPPVTKFLFSSFVIEVLIGTVLVDFQYLAFIPGNVLKVFKRKNGKGVEGEGKQIEFNANKEQRNGQFTPFLPVFNLFLIDTISRSLETIYSILLPKLWIEFCFPAIFSI